MSRANRNLLADGLDATQSERADELAATIPEGGIDTEAFRELARLYSDESDYEVGGGAAFCTSTMMLEAIGKRAYPDGPDPGAKLGVTARDDDAAAHPPEIHLRDRRDGEGRPEPTTGSPNEWACRCCGDRVTVTDSGEVGHNRGCPHRTDVSSDTVYANQKKNLNRCPECGATGGQHRTGKTNPRVTACDRHGEGYVCYCCGESFGEGWDGLAAYSDHYRDVHGGRGNLAFDACPHLHEIAYEKHREAYLDYLADNRRGVVDCPECDTVQLRTRGRAKERKYCSGSCANEGKKKRVTFVCDECEGEKEMPKAEAKKRDYCSHECAQKASEKKELFICAHCEERELLKKSEAESKTYCSHECARKAQKKDNRVRWECNGCGEVKTLTEGEAKRRKYCDHECYADTRSGKSLSEYTKESGISDGDGEREDAVTPASAD